jgi:hypothetical protein
VGQQVEVFAGYALEDPFGRFESGLALLLLVGLQLGLLALPPLN